MDTLENMLKGLTTAQGSKVLMYCDLRGMVHSLVSRGIGVLAVTGLAMAELHWLDRDRTSVLHPFLFGLDLTVLLVTAAYAAIAVTMTLSLGRVRQEIRDIGINPNLIMRLDALPAKALATRLKLP